MQGPIDDCMRSVTVSGSLGGGSPFNHIANIEIDTLINGKITNTQNFSWDSFATPANSFEVLLGKCPNVGDLVQIVVKNPPAQPSIPLNTITVESHEKYNVTTAQYNNARTGWFANETKLTVASLKQKGANFKRQFKMEVDKFNGAGPKIYAQPLYLHHVNFPNIGVRNAVFIAAENNMVYAFDADNFVPDNTDPTSGKGIQIWKRELLIKITYPVKINERTPTNADVGSGDIQPCVGISSTPVIDCNCDCDCDTSVPVMYVTSKVFDTGANTFRYYLYALDVTTGNDHIPPVIIQANYYGSGGDDVSSDTSGNKTSTGKNIVQFQAKIHNNRPGLLLLNGTIYIAFASHGDNFWYNGWIIGYDAATLKQTSVFCSTPDGSFRRRWVPLHPTKDDKGVLHTAIDDPFFDSNADKPAGGIWQSGCGLAADDANIYCTTGNGTFDANDLNTGAQTGKRDFGDSVLKLSQSLQVLSYFTPADQNILNGADIDLASGGVMILPAQNTLTHQNLLVTCGKAGDIFVLDRNNLGGYNGPPSASDDPVIDNPNAVSVKELQEMKPPFTVKDRLQGDSSAGIWGGPAFLDKGNAGQFIFYGSNGDTANVNGTAGTLKAFLLQNGGLTLKGQSNESFPLMGTTPIVSSNQSITGSGIVWAVLRDRNNVHLRAYSADDLCNGKNVNSIIGDLFVGGWANTRPFLIPTVINGKIYVACDNLVAVFF